MAAPISVTVSYAQSIDGRIATATGDSRYISGAATLRLAQRLRATHETILVGIGTVLRDDPGLTCRLPGRRSPARIVLDVCLRLPPEGTLARTAREIPVFALTGPASQGNWKPEVRERLEAAGVRVVELPLEAPGRVSAAAVANFLAREGFRSLFVEGGGQVITSFLRSGLVRRLLVVIAPLVIGAGVEAVGDLGVRELAGALRPDRSRVRRMGEDLVWELEFRGA
jgi:riboflavin-specific deaminase-like protein